MRSPNRHPWWLQIPSSSEARYGAWMIDFLRFAHGLVADRVRGRTALLAENALVWEARADRAVTGNRWAAATDVAEGPAGRGEVGRWPVVALPLQLRNAYIRSSSSNTAEKSFSWVTGGAPLFGAPPGAPLERHGWT